MGDIDGISRYFSVCIQGDVVLYQHLFWFFGHPEVYILILPAFGIILKAIMTINKISGNIIVINGILGIGIIGTVVWVHHMYTTNLQADTIIFHNLTTLLVGIPTANKIHTLLLLKTLP